MCPNDMPTEVVLVLEVLNWERATCKMCCKVHCVEAGKVQSAGIRCDDQHLDVTDEAGACKQHKPGDTRPTGFQH